MAFVGRFQTDYACLLGSGLQAIQYTGSARNSSTTNSCCSSCSTLHSWLGGCSNNSTKHNPSSEDYLTLHVLHVGLTAGVLTSAWRNSSGSRTSLAAVMVEVIVISSSDDEDAIPVNSSAEEGHPGLQAAPMGSGSMGAVQALAGMKHDQQPPQLEGKPAACRAAPLGLTWCTPPVISSGCGPINKHQVQHMMFTCQAVLACFKFTCQHIEQQLHAPPHVQLVSSWHHAQADGEGYHASCTWLHDLCRWSQHYRIAGQPRHRIPGPSRSGRGTAGPIRC